MTINNHYFEIPKEASSVFSDFPELDVEDLVHLFQTSKANWYQCTSTFTCAEYNKLGKTKYGSIHKEVTQEEFIEYTQEPVKKLANLMGLSEYSYPPSLSYSLVEKIQIAEKIEQLRVVFLRTCFLKRVLYVKGFGLPHSLSKEFSEILLNCTNSFYFKKLIKRTREKPKTLLAFENYKIYKQLKTPEVVNGIFFRIMNKQDQTIGFLLGTIHEFDNALLAKLNKKILRCLSTSTAIFFEIDQLNLEETISGTIDMNPETLSEEDRLDISVEAQKVSISF